MSAMSGLRVLVTGGASGIGEETVGLFTQLGARVGALDMRMASRPVDGCAYATADIADRQATTAAVEALAEELGGIDVLVNNAGIGAQGGIDANTDQEWLRVLDVNVIGIARVTSAALPHLRKSSRASVINVSSVLANLGVPDRALYSASKGAVQSLTYAMAADGISSNIRVNCVAPGTADTPWISRLLESADDPTAARASLTNRQPMGRLVSAREVAEAIVYLAHPSNGSVTGTSLTVDGGMTKLRIPAQS